MICPGRVSGPLSTNPFTYMSLGQVLSDGFCCAYWPETLPGHIIELQRLREAMWRPRSGHYRRPICRSHYLIHAMPSWDPVIGSLGGILDPIVIISHLNTKWSRRQGLTSTISTSKDSNVIFQTASSHHPSVTIATVQVTQRLGAGRRAEG